MSAGVGAARSRWPCCWRNAFFVGAEFAVISARRSQIEPLAQRRARAAPAPRCGRWSTCR